MLFNQLQVLFQGGSIDIVSVIVQLLAILFVIAFILPFHEYAHALIAYKLGDMGPKYDKRLTLNPIASIDPFGSLALLLFGYGWAKPVMVNPRAFKNPKRDMAIVAAAGPISNLLAGFVGLLLMNIIVLFPYNQVTYYFILFLNYYVVVNVSLATFNLIPIPPLDGSRIVAAFLSDSALRKYYGFQNYFFMIFFVLMFSGILSVPLNFVSSFLLNGMDFIAGLPFVFFQ